MRTSYGRFFVVVAITSAALAGTASAQSPLSRLEVGGQVSALRLSDFDATNLGLGGRLSFDVTRWVALETEFSFFPHDDVTVLNRTPTPGFDVAYRRRRAEAVFGPKIGVRGQRVGIFGKVRPGLARLSHQGVGCAGEVCALVLLARPVYHTEFALDVGGVAEFYPSSHTVVRADVGTMLVRHRDGAPPCWTAGCTSQNFSSRFGFGVRF